MARSRRNRGGDPPIEAVTGHCQTDGHLERNFLHGRLGDQINAVMSAVGYNLRLILKWPRKLLWKINAASNYSTRLAQ